MAKDVSKALAEALVSTGREENEAEANKRIAQLKEEGRILHDIWSPIDEYD